MWEIIEIDNIRFQFLWSLADNEFLIIRADAPTNLGYLTETEVLNNKISITPDQIDYGIYSVYDKELKSNYTSYLKALNKIKKLQVLK